MVISQTAEYMTRAIPRWLCQVILSPMWAVYLKGSISNSVLYYKSLSSKCTDHFHSTPRDNGHVLLIKYVCLKCKNNWKCHHYWCNIILPTVHGARPQNLALNKPAWTATNQTLNPPGVAVDGDTSTIMETTSPWPFLAIDLQGWYKLERTWFNQLTGEWQWIYDGYGNCCLINYKTHFYIIPYIPTRIYKRARAAKKNSPVSYCVDFWEWCNVIYSPYI